MSPCPVSLKVHLRGHLGLPLGQCHLSPHISTPDSSAALPSSGLGSSPLLEPEGGKGKSIGLSARMPTFQS